MKVLKTILIVCFIKSNTAVDDHFKVLDKHANLQNMINEGFDSNNGQENWEYVQNNPNKDWLYDESNAYANMLKAFDKTQVLNAGAEVWVNWHNMTKDAMILYDHGFVPDDDEKNLNFVKDHWKDTDSKTGKHRVWNSKIGEQYAKYIYNYDKNENGALLSPLSWVRKYIYNCKDDDTEDDRNIMKMYNDGIHK